MNCFFNPIKTSVSKDGGGVGGKKRTALFQTYDWEKEKVFQRACTCICRETRKYVAGVPRPSRVDISCMSKVSGPLFLPILPFKQPRRQNKEGTHLWKSGAQSAELDNAPELLPAPPSFDQVESEKRIETCASPARVEADSVSAAVLLLAFSLSPAVQPRTSSKVI